MLVPGTDGEMNGAAAAADARHDASRILPEGGPDRGPSRRPQTSTQTSASTYMPIGVDNAWSNEAFDAGFSMQVRAHTIHGNGVA